MPGNAALFDLQSECPSMNAATFYKHCGYIYILKVSVQILHPIILDCKFPVTETELVFFLIYTTFWLWNIKKYFIDWSN